MFKGLTQTAQRVLQILSQEEAKAFHSDQLFPEHIVLAILKYGNGFGCKALEKLSVDIQKLQLCIAEKTSTKKRRLYAW